MLKYMDITSGPSVKTSLSVLVFINNYKTIACHLLKLITNHGEQ